MFLKKETINILFRKLGLIAILFFFIGCDEKTFQSDLEIAKTAYLERNLSLAERLLERYLREEQDPEKRWTAWNLLLKVINGNNQAVRASLECLESLLVEYENDNEKLAEILPLMGEYNTILRQYKRAADCWSTYIDMLEVNSAQRIQAYRNLAAIQFGQRHFTAGEETLQECLSLPVPDHEKISCMLDLADENITLERWQDAADLCQQVLDANPDKKDYGMACYLRGDALEQLGKNAEALKQYELARDTYPNTLVIENRIENLNKIINKK